MYLSQSILLEKLKEKGERNISVALFYLYTFQYIQIEKNYSTRKIERKWTSNISVA